MLTDKEKIEIILKERIEVRTIGIEFQAAIEKETVLRKLAIKLCDIIINLDILGTHPHSNLSFTNWELLLNSQPNLSVIESYSIQAYTFINWFKFAVFRFNKS